MRRTPLVNFLFSDGLHTSGIQSITRQTNMARGSKNVMMIGDNKPNVVRRPLLLAGKTGSRIAMPVGASYGGLGSYGQSNILGSITKILAAIFFSGSGAVYLDGVSLSANASSILQIKVLSGGVYGSTFQAGLSQPLSGSLALRESLGAGFTGRLMTGSYSSKVYKIRSATGARSVASETSNIIIATETNGVGQSARFTAPDEDTNGGDAWGFCVSPKQFGSTGPHFLLRETTEAELTTVDSVPRSVEIEWTDGDLIGKPLAPTESFPPPTCMFSGSLGECFFVDGAYGDITLGVTSTAPGSTIAVSLLNRPEEFPADWLIFPPEAPTALIRGGEGFYYRFGRNSMGVLSFVGGEPPLSFLLYWANVGVAYPHNACVAEGGRLYAKTGQRGLVRIGAGGSIETNWANQVIDEIAEFDDENTVLGWDEDSQSLCIFNNTEVYIFNSNLEKWGYQDLSGLITGKVVSAVTDRSVLKFTAEDAGTGVLRIYQFNAGTGTVSLEQRSDWYFSNGETDLVRQIDIKMRADTLNEVEVKLYANENGDDPVITRTLTPSKTGLVYLPPLLPAIPNLRSFSINLKQTSDGGDCGFEEIVVSGVSRLIKRT